jgi:hypothetical protein
MLATYSKSLLTNNRSGKLGKSEIKEVWIHLKLKQEAFTLVQCRNAIRKDDCRCCRHVPSEKKP